MGELQSLILLVGLFGLRVVVPLAVIGGLGYVLKRLDERWQADATRQRQPWSGAVPRQSVPVLGDGLMLQDNAPCWVRRDCGLERRAECPAWLRPELPCWLARMEVESQLPSACPGCASFVQVVGQD